MAIKADDALRLRLAGLYYHNKQYGEAASQSEQLLKKSWQKQAAIIRLSALTALQRYGVAADQAAELIRHEPTESKWWQQAVSLNLSAKRGDQALALLQTAIDRKLMDDAATRNQLIRLYAWQGLPYRGARLLETAMAKGQMKQSADNRQLLAQLWKVRVSGRRPSIAGRCSPANMPIPRRPCAPPSCCCNKAEPMRP